MISRHQERGIGMTSQRTRDRLVTRLQEEGIRNTQVLETIRNTPRHLFVDEALASRAYEDTALPIGHGQTISQPYIVARMTELLMDTKHDKVLEVGTGSGYQAAVLSPLVDAVYSTERIEPLAAQARQRYRRLGYRNIRVRHSDGTWGWPESGPYDAIVVTAGAAEIPEPLLQQLNIEGMLIMPVGQRGGQKLIRVTRKQEVYEREEFGAVSFVPLISGNGS
ncbi:MAG: protein-L-isoaspartate(D-aspartate) O-methyltransferase [Gammaproteobacteria bacterium]